MQRIHVFISGGVQGVFFRANTREIANKLDITGWVKNLPNDGVEVVAEGKEESIKEFIKFLNKGPKYAVVKDIKIKYERYKKEFNDFKIIY